MNGHGNHGQNNKQGGNIQSSQRSRMPEIKSYTGADGKLRPKLFDKEARETAEAMENISHTQLRRFFGQVMADKRRFDLNPDSKDSEAQVAMALFKAKAAYAAARSKENKPIGDFAELHVELINSIEDFRNFARHFEAVIAWHKAYGNK